MVCLNSPEFKTVILDTVNPQYELMISELRNARAAISQQASFIGQLREQLLFQNNQLLQQEKTINELKASVAIAKTTLNADKKDQLLQLKITGLQGETGEERIASLIESAKALDTPVELSTDEIKIATIKPKPKEGKPTPPEIHIFTLSNIWKKRELYAARRQFSGTGVYLSENLGPKQRALHFKCRQLRKEGKIKATWSNELVIFVKTNDEQRLPIANEADLAPFTAQVPSYSSHSRVKQNTPAVFSEPPHNSTPMPGHHQANFRIGQTGSVISVQGSGSPPPPIPARSLFPTPPHQVTNQVDFDIANITMNNRR